MPTSTLIPILVRETERQKPRRITHTQPVLGFSSGSIRATETVGEVWYTTAPNIRITDLAGEVWYTTSPKIRPTQVVAEIWFQVPPKQPNPPAFLPFDLPVHRKQKPVHSDPAWVPPYTVPFIQAFPYFTEGSPAKLRKPRDFEPPTFIPSAIVVASTFIAQPIDDFHRRDRPRIGDQPVFVPTTTVVTFTPPPFVCWIE